MLKKIFLVFLAVLMLAGTLAACGTPETPSNTLTPPTPANPTNPGDPPPPVFTPGEEILTVSVATWNMNTDFLTQDDPVYDMIKERFGIEFEPWPLTWDGYKDLVKTWVATGDPPDLFTLPMASDSGSEPTQTYLSWVADGLMHPMPEDMSPYPNLAWRYERPEAQMLMVDGKYWSVPRFRERNGNSWATNHGWWYRKDWAQNLGFSSISNYDELLAFLRAVRDGDPTGTGATGIIPIVQSSRRHVFTTNMLWRVFEKRPYGSWQYEDGVLYRAHEAPNSFEAAVAIRELFNEGLIDPDILIDPLSGVDKFVANQAAVICSAMFGGNNIWESFLLNNPDKTLEGSIGWIPFLPNVNDGIAYAFDWPTNFWGETFIPSHVDNEKYWRIIAFLDFTSSDEWLNMYFHGIEGVDWQQDASGNITYLTPDGERPNVLEKYPVMAGISELTLLFEGRRFNKYRTNYPYMAELSDSFHDTAALLTPEPTTPLTFMVNTPLDEVFVDETEALIGLFMYGGSTGDPKAEWDEMMATLRNAGLDDVIAAKVEAVRALGRIP